MDTHLSSANAVREFSLRAVLLGLAFGFFFAVANAYLALKIGTTISASIPAAILAMSTMKLFFRKSTLLEYNIVQTIATVGEAIACGVVFTIPALFFLGEAPSPWRIFLLSVLGGILGILFMIPMRRYLIVEEHKRLPFPEGTACAEILKASEQSIKAAISAIYGLVISALYKLCSSALFLWGETVSWTKFKYVSFSITTSPALFGVGYIIGPQISSLMFAGAVTAWWVIVPLISEFGLGKIAIYPSSIPVESMNPTAIWNSYVRYIGAGTVAIGGLAGLIRIFPIIHKALHVGIKELFAGFSSHVPKERTDQDISMGWLIVGSILIILTLWLFPEMPMNFFTIVLLAVLAFIFTAVTSLTVGLIGSTSNPVSGMVITILLITCVSFVLLGWTERIYLVSAMTMGCVACITICMAGTTSQDLKAGFLLGATPRSQQIAEILGVFIPSLALAYTVYILNEAYHFGSPSMPAPQGTLMAMIAEGVISGNLPYELTGIGVVIGLVMALLRVPILPFALGLYLPFSISSAAMVGGTLRYLIEKSRASELEHERGTLLSAGFVGGDALMGVLIALLAVSGVIPADAPGKFPNWVSFALFLALGFLSFALIKKKK